MPKQTDKGFHFVDCGTSGGVWGLKEGYSLMIGGDKEPVERLTTDLRGAGAGEGSRDGDVWAFGRRDTSSRWCTTELSTA